MADDEAPPITVWGASTGSTLKILGEYDPEITKEVDRQIRNMPVVVDYCLSKARELLKSINSNNFEIVLSTEKGGKVLSDAVNVSGRHYLKGRQLGDTSEHGPERQRPRAYVVPANGKGIHEELTEAVLLKAALGMAGK